MGLKILVVDDEKIQREMLRDFLDKQGFQVITAAGGREAVRLFRDLPLQLVLLDHKMPDMTGDEVLREMKEINPEVRAIMITAYGAVDTAVTVMKLGADDFLEKPVDLTVLLGKLREIERDLVQEDEVLEVNAIAYDRSCNSVAQQTLPLKIVGSSPAMTELLSMTSRIAPSPWNVLIRGETGTGKELVARLIHMLSPRNNRPFVEVNCAAIPEHLFESELFGHEKGAFTGAVSRKKGRFELAQGGSVFLDEIGEMPLNLQAKLLRVLQEKRICRVGSEQDFPVDIRLIAATNRDLKHMVTEGLFREDLYYRLHVLELVIPPLRQRKEDVKELINYFIEKFGSKKLSFSSEAMTALIKYPFPGNVRELEHIIQRIVTLTRGKVVNISDLPLEPQIMDDQLGKLENRLGRVEKQMISEALERHKGVQTRAADELGISERVLRYKMVKLGLKD